MATTQQQIADQLEALIDASTLAIVLDALADVCHAKAEHLTSNWQDSTSARHWSDMGRRIGTVGGQALTRFGR
jgi:hypothetical protein